MLDRVNWYLVELDRHLSDFPDERRQILLTEVESHLREQADDMASEGMAMTDAEAEAVRVFGEPAQFAARLREEAPKTTLRGHSPCTLCGKPRELAEKMIAGLYGSVCGECVEPAAVAARASVKAPESKEKTRCCLCGLRPRSLSVGIHGAICPDCIQLCRGLHDGTIVRPSSAEASLRGTAPSTTGYLAAVALVVLAMPFVQSRPLVWTAALLALCLAVIVVGVKGSPRITLASILLGIGVGGFLATLLISLTFADYGAQDGYSIRPLNEVTAIASDPSMDRLTTAPPPFEGLYNPRLEAQKALAAPFVARLSGFMRSGYTVSLMGSIGLLAAWLYRRVARFVRAISRPRRAEKVEI